VLNQFLLKKDNFEIIKPEVGVTIHEGNEIKSGGNQYFEKYKRFSLEDYSKMLKDMAFQPEIDKNVQNRYGYTPLMLACYRSNKTMAIMLIDHGVDINLTTTPQHQTALMMACECRNLYITRKLIENHVDVDVQDNIYGDTALTIISKYYQMNTIMSLLVEKAGANVNIANHKGETPLFLSCQANNIEHVKILVEHGAKINVKIEEIKQIRMIEQPIGLPDQQQLEVSVKPHY